MLTTKNKVTLFVKGLGKRIKQIGLFIEYTQCVGMKILYLLFIILVQDYSYKKQTSLTLQCCTLIRTFKSFSKGLLMLILL